MTNMRLIDEAVKLVVDLFEVEGITESTETIKARAIEWYNHSEIVDAEMLAAAIITGPYVVGTSWDDLLDWKEFYFPSIEIEEMLAMENFHISEIEDAQKDFMWQ